MTSKAPLAVTMGDPAGIGPDILLEAWCVRDREALPPFYALGDPELLEGRARELGLSVPICEVQDGVTKDLISPNALSVSAIPLAQPTVAGRPSAENGPAVISAIETAVADVRCGRAAAMVTNPINKKLLYECGFRYPGHTEFLGALAAQGDSGPAPVMMLVAGSFRVVPATIHIPLREVFAALSVEGIAETARTVAVDLKRWFGIVAPRIAMTGLNPHAGEEGHLGQEEASVIVPAIDLLRGEGLIVSGPHAADSLFHAEARQGYDAAIAMYHDQALIPIKTLAFEDAVNVTLGLPFLRTSPDHGTAFDIAGTGRASPRSLIAALRLAGQLTAASGDPE